MRGPLPDSAPHDTERRRMGDEENDEQATPEAGAPSSDTPSSLSPSASPPFTLEWRRSIAHSYPPHVQSLCLGLGHGQRNWMRAKRGRMDCEDDSCVADGWEERARRARSIQPQHPFYRLAQAHSTPALHTEQQGDSSRFFVPKHLSIHLSTMLAETQHFDDAAPPQCRPSTAPASQVQRPDSLGPAPAPQDRLTDDADEASYVSLNSPPVHQPHRLRRSGGFYECGKRASDRSLAELLHEPPEEHAQRQSAQAALSQLQRAVSPEQTPRCSQAAMQWCMSPDDDSGRDLPREHPSLLSSPSELSPPASSASPSASPEAAVIYSNDPANPHRKNLLAVLACTLEQICPTDAPMPRDTLFLSLFHTSALPSISIADYLARLANYTGCSDECLVQAVIHILTLARHGQEEVELTRARENEEKLFTPISSASSPASSESGSSVSSFYCDSSPELFGPHEAYPRTHPHPRINSFSPQPFTVSCYNLHRLLLAAILATSKFTDDMFYNNCIYSNLGGISLRELNRLECEFLRLLDYRLFVSSHRFLLMWDTEINSERRHGNGACKAKHTCGPSFRTKEGAMEANVGAAEREPSRLSEEERAERDWMECTQSVAHVRLSSDTSSSDQWSGRPTRPSAPQAASRARAHSSPTLRPRSATMVSESSMRDLSVSHSLHSLHSSSAASSPRYSSLPSSSPSDSELHDPESRCAAEGMDLTQAESDPHAYDTHDCVPPRRDAVGFDASMRGSCAADLQSSPPSPSRSPIAACASAERTSGTFHARACSIGIQQRNTSTHAVYKLLEWK